MATPEELAKLRRASEQSAEKARKLLDDEVSDIMAEVARISELKPETADEETYEKLVSVVTEATRRNESIAAIKKNVEELGDSAVALFKEMASIAKGLS